MKIIIRTISVALLFICLATAQDEFIEFKEKSKKEFQVFTEESKNEYSTFVIDANNEYLANKSKIEKQWGEFKLSTQKEFVTYNQNYDTRTATDFENGKIRIDVIAGKFPSLSLKKIKKKMSKALHSATQIKVTESISLIKSQLAIFKTPEANTTIGESRAIDRYIETIDLKKTKSHGKVMYSVEIPLLPNHLQIRVNKYRPYVDKYSRQFQVDPALVYAIIETESAFNPYARSPIPAYGLMQLVPNTGARDASRYINSKQKITPNSLFDPETNIKLGCAYISLLKHQYLKAVSSEENSLLCTIAAYNGGPGNLARGITGNNNLNQAIRTINNKSHNELLSALKNGNLPKETKNYLDLVLDRMGKYQGG